MPKVCAVTGKKPQYGHRVSHANNKSKRRFEPNLHSKKFWVPSENRFVKLKVSSRGIRNINKLGIDKVLRDMRKNGGKV
ncbi:MAG TPA: 50S ribosomal protein L28 [Bryobacteraceae bacterium]|nr:50S ribosomal protein L28 [Bryobacteraceae bacterium]